MARQRTAGFTLVELVVATAVVGLIVVAITNTFIAVESIQRQNRRLDLATRIAEAKIESLRNNHFNTLPIGSPAITFTSELPAELATPRSATINITEPQAGIKRLDVTITYQDGRRARTVTLTSLIGNIGIAQ